MTVDFNNPNTIIDAAIDNFDQNEEILDGKNTTHILAMVAYQRCKLNSGFEYFAEKFHSKSFNVPNETQLEKLEYFLKPKTKHDPPCYPFKGNVFPLIDLSSNPIVECAMKDLLWTIQNKFEKNFSWEKNNSVVLGKGLPITSVTFLPFINNPVSDMNTISTYRKSSWTASYVRHNSQQIWPFIQKLWKFYGLDNMSYQNPLPCELVECISFRTL